MRSQPRSDKPRIPSYTSALPEVERAVRFTARKFGVSKSWVRTVALAQFFGIEATHFDEAVERRKGLKLVATRRRRRG